MGAADTKTFKVVRLLSVRSQPSLNAQRIGDGLPVDQVITVKADSRKEADGFIWWQHDLGWSAERSTDSSRVFLEEVATAPATEPATEPAAPAETPAAPAETPSETPATTPAPTTQRFRVTQTLSIRKQPSTSGERLADTFLNLDQIVEVSIASRTEADGFVWWQHDLGWSAERKLDGSTVFMNLVTDEAPATTSTSTQPELSVATKEGRTFTAVKRFRVVQTLSIRSDPSLSGARSTKTLDIGVVLDVDGESRTEADGFVWWQHQDGWSAERKLDGTIVFLGDPDAKPAERADGTVDPEGLPDRDALFKRIPVDLSQTKWIQYFGNTQFAFEQGARWKYPVFAQGLHSGFDFGNGVRGNPPDVIQVFAGVEGTFLRSDRFGVAVRSGQYVIIYQHLTGPGSYVKDAPVTPDTLVGIMDPSLGSNRHLHLEVRYNREKWIVNPLLLMPESMRGPIISRWSNFASNFCSANGFTQWQTPLDQPMILRGGPVIGPTA